jgi:hypothetical protein
MAEATSGENLRVRDIRTLPFFWIQRALIDTIRPTWKGLVAYNALAYYSSGDSGKCRDVSRKVMADRVGVSEDTIVRGLAELEAKKAIKIRPRQRTKNGKKFHLTHEYILIDLSIQHIQPI